MRDSVEAAAAAIIDPGRWLGGYLVMVVCLLGIGSGCHYAVPEQAANEPFRFEHDRFAFANETVWNYVDGQVQPDSDEADDSERRYTRSCFVMCRGALKFWKFVRFEPESPPLSQAELVQKIRKIRQFSPASPPLPEAERVVIPGYENLHQVSARYPGLFQDHLGSGWATYFRPGNVALVLPTFGAHQQRLHEALSRSIAKGHPFVLWLVNFPSVNINHAVLVYDVVATEPVYRYLVYDPNDAKEPKELTYDPQARAFAFQPTFYFEGGGVTARPVYQRRHLRKSQ